MSLLIETVISGGQTGADRAALDFAIRYDIPHGGWCPKGRLSEDGPIEEHYNLKETSTKSYPQRTEKNVLESDGTVIFTILPKLKGGSKKTADLAREQRKADIHLHAGSNDKVAKLTDFISRNNIHTLNVAGSRASKEPAVYQLVYETLEKALSAKG